MRTGVAAACVFVISLIGCARQTTVVELFPVGAQASPWVLVGEVWSGTFDAAAAGLGDDAERLRPFGPQRVWLAIYGHDTHSMRRLTARVFAFATPERAGEALRVLAPGEPNPFNAGDEGFWTDDGVAYRQGRLLFDIFGNRGDAIAIPEQAVYLSAYFEQRMTRELGENPK